MNGSKPTPILLSEYRPPSHLISHAYLDFDLDLHHTHVRSRLHITANGQHDDHLVLQGEHLELLSVSLNGQPLDSSKYSVTDRTLTLFSPPAEFTLEIETRIHPESNTALEGLYQSGAMFCSQNEPEGFRRITYFLDRPDVMTRFRTRISADRERFPILLSNGNPVDQGQEENGRHWMEWEDPFPKPCYLFALVAGDLGMIQDEFLTCSGRTIQLRVYCDKGNEFKCTHAMNSLKKAMKWDEETFGLEYDLDIFMIVAVDAFNFGAMENKGLNIFNSHYVLADPETATDDDFLGIESVVAHEYFHNWTGNRVTCRDWFQLTLKEGLTVFRDQEFSADTHSRPLKRIQDVLRLRAAQFPEDAGPMAHPIKPSSYVEINNFYTATVYEKGAEVIRMLYTMLGKEQFRRGITKYFELYDGQAVTTEDFLFAMEQVSKRDLTQFKRWYHQAGTPEIRLGYDYNYATQTLYLTVEQSCPATADESPKEPLHFPLEVGLMNEAGEDIPLKLNGHRRVPSGLLIEITRARETFAFQHISQRPIVSVNRGFSAPIRVHAEYSWNDYQFLMAHDADPFTRWEAGQELATQIMLSLLNDLDEGNELEVFEGFFDAYERILCDTSLEDSLKAKALMLPSEDSLHQRLDLIDFDGVHLIRQWLFKALAERFEPEFVHLSETMRESGAYQLTSESIGKRSLKNLALAFLAKSEKEEHLNRCYDHYQRASNMTDRYAMLQCLCDSDSPHRDEALEAFYQRYQKDKLVVAKWLTVQAGSAFGDTLKQVQNLLKHPGYDKMIPNLARALLRTFGRNCIHFHANTGEAYHFMADQILDMDEINPQVAAILADPFKTFNRLDSLRKKAMRPQLHRILESSALSPNVYEIVSKCLAQDTKLSNLSPS